MRYLYKIPLLILLLVLFGFALKNVQPVVLRFYLEYEWSAPLIVYLLAFFFGGAALGVLAWLPYIFRRRREISRLKRELRTRHQSSGFQTSAAENPLDAS